MPETNFDVCEDGQVERNEKDKGKYKSLVLKEEEERLQMARELVPEQMMVLQEVVKFCKSSTIPKSSWAQKNSHLRLIVHGGAGVGKSKTINACAQWAEKLLRLPGPYLPRVLVLGPTGASASLIEGQTIHSTFDFKFGDEYRPLSDKSLDLF